MLPQNVSVAAPAAAPVAAPAYDSSGSLPDDYLLSIQPRVSEDGWIIVAAIVVSFNVICTPLPRQPTYMHFRHLSRMPAAVVQSIHAHPNFECWQHRPMTWHDSASIPFHQSSCRGGLSVHVLTGISTLLWIYGHKRVLQAWKGIGLTVIGKRPWRRVSIIDGLIRHRSSAYLHACNMVSM